MKKKSFHQRNNHLNKMQWLIKKNKTKKLTDKPNTGMEEIEQKKSMNLKTER